MTIWIDAQLSPLLARWIADAFGLNCVAVRELGLHTARDIDIFRGARDADAIVLTKDADFPHLLSRHGPPRKIIWLTCGNTSNANLRQILSTALPQALKVIESGESLVEIAEPR